MAATLNPQEIFLLERYSSLAYFEPLRDDFAALVKTTELALAEFMANLPPDYRAQPLWMQPDIVWGQRVLPNIRATLQGLNMSYIAISHGDMNSLGSSVGNDFIAIQRDYPIDWMAEAHQQRWDELETRCRRRARNINHTEHATWLTGDLTWDYDPPSRGPLDPPASWPIYRVNDSAKLKTGEWIQHSGVYLPDTDGACAQFLIKGRVAREADVPVPYDDPALAGQFDRRSEIATWTLVERVADSGGGTPGATDPIAAGIRLRCEAGHPCPQAGWWFTPASADSRRHFQHGQVMPDSHSSYGATIWQWDERQ
ncbi:MAG: hypothetical protein HUU30_20260 [Burkholderiaceae bacterium]|nr:hypothetical protein [Aquabacterium sp.]NUP88060.1 hypothetical protein [Burkholderiaceae bacterium]